MMTVRFSTGVSITYNDANFISWAIDRNGFHKLYTEQGGDLIAYVPGEALIEWRQYCKMENPTTGMTYKHALEIVTEHIKEFNNGSGHNLVKIKRALQDFDGRTLCWKK